ncbi:MAG: hypothetical protein ABJ237_04560, partial [Parasphingorhabdus sp.]|uniref:hypothetical protein n=1 Tax=Parasphingorhabdus sp. TaxID=2709688 RepID=UPI00329A1A3C
GPCIERGKSTFTILVRGDDDGGNITGTRHHPDFSDEFRTIHLRHTIVDDHQVYAILFQPMECFYRICVRNGGIFFPHQRHKLGINPQIGGSIIDY